MCTFLALGFMFLYLDILHFMLLDLEYVKIICFLFAMFYVTLYS